MNLTQASGLVHAPPQEWARFRDSVIAIASGSQTLTFAALHAAVTQRAQALQTSCAPGFCRDSGVWPKEVGLPVR